MSDFENDSECLKIHLGSRLSDSSDSCDNDELDEEYHKLRPSPISAAVIRQNAIYRPPSPNIEVPKTNLPVSSGSLASKKVSRRKSTTKNVVVSRKHGVIRFTQEEKIVGVHLKIAKDLVRVQYEMSSYTTKLSLSYLDALEKFRINLDCFGKSVKNLNSKKSLAICSIAPPEIIVTLENSIENFRTLLSNLYAFIISEYLLILIESSRFNRSRIPSIIIKTLDLIENIGSINEIQKKLQYRTLKSIDDLNFGPFVAVKSTNDEIMNELNILFPKTDEIKKTRRRRMRENKLNFTNYIEPKQKEIFGYEKITTENKKIKKLEKSQELLAKSNAIVQVSGISNDKVENFNDSINFQPFHNKLSKQQESSSIVISSSKKKRRRRCRKKQICSKEIPSLEKSIITNVKENIQEIETILDEKTDININNTNTIDLYYNNEVSRAQNKREFDIQNSNVISEELTNIRITDSQEIVSEVDDSEKCTLNISQENVENKKNGINSVNTNLSDIFEKSSDRNASTGNVIYSEFKKVGFDGMYQVTKHEDRKNPYNESISKHSIDRSSKKSEVINSVQHVHELENFSGKINKGDSTSFSTSCNTESLDMKQLSLDKVIKVYEANCTTENTEENVEMSKDVITQNPKNQVIIETIKNEYKENIDIIESGYHSESELRDLSKYHSHYKIGSIIFHELCKHKETISVKKESDAQKLEYNFEVACQFVKGGEHPHFITESILRLAEFSNLKIISLLNIFQYSITNFELEYSTAAFDTIKDCLEILHYIHSCNDLMLHVSSAKMLVEIKKCYLPTSRVCQAHLYGFIISQSTEFIRLLKCRHAENEAKLLYQEFLELTDIFGTSEEISAKLKYRNDNIYIELAQQVCSVIPVTYISASNRDIVGNIESIRKARKKFIIKPIEVLVHHLKIPSTQWMPKCTEFDDLHFDIKKAEILVELENYIYYSDYLSDTDLKLKFENMRKFCILLKTLEEQEKKEFQLGTFVHAFLHHVDSILSRHIFRIMISQFYTFIFHMLSVHFSHLSKLSSKEDAKSFRNILIDLMSFLCPIEQIPEKLRFRNDQLFSEFTNKIYSIEGIKIKKSSKELCKEISGILKSNKCTFEKLTTGYISLPSDFKTQILKLEGKISNTHELFNIRFRENGKLITFKTLAIDILRKQIETLHHASPRKSKQIKLKDNSPNIERFDLSLGGLQSELKTETTVIENRKKKKGPLKLKVQSESNLQKPQTKHTNFSENVDDLCSELVVKLIDSVVTKTLSEMKYMDAKTFSISVEYNLKTINVLNVLQYTMNTFEIKYSNASIQVLNNCFDILDSIFEYNRSLLNVCSEQSLKDIIQVSYFSLSELCQSNLYVNILYFCCLFAKALSNQYIHENSKKLYFQLLEMIEALGTIENISNKLKCRNDNFYVVFAQKVCSIIPVVCSPLSNVELLQQLLLIRNSLENQIDSLEFEMENILEFENVKLKTELHNMPVPKWIEMENLQLDLKKIEVLCTLQYKLHHSEKFLSEENSVFEDMTIFLVVLEKLERNQENEPLESGSVHELLLNLKTVLTRHLSRIFISHFYSYILSAILQLIHNLSNLTEEWMNSFRLKIFNLLISVCPLEKLPEKLQFRNDAVYLAYLKALLNKEGILVAKSSEIILQETLDIFKTNKIYFEKVNSVEGLSIKLDEFERNTVWTRELINISLDKYLNISLKEDIEKFHIEPNSNKKKDDTSVIAINSKSGIKRVEEVVQYLHTFVKSDVRDIIIQIMSNPEDANISSNSIMRRIEYSCIKTITLFNNLQYSFNTFSIKYSTAAFESILDCLRLLNHIGQFTKLLHVSSSSKLQEIEISYTPILEICQSYFYAYVLSSCSNFMSILKCQKYQKNSKIYLKVFEMIEAFGTREEIYEKLKHRNDNCYIELVEELCSVIPSTLLLPCNKFLLENITYVGDILDSNMIVKFIITEKPRTMSVKHKVTKLRKNKFEFECLQLDINKIKELTELQYDINFHDQFPTKFCIVFENMINFFVKLKSFEQNEIELPEYGTFVDDFVENLNIISSLHISRILIAQFYSFIFSISLNVLKILPELVSKDEVTVFHLKLINLLSSNCAIDQVFQKIQFRNDAVYSNYIGDILNMKVIEVSKSYDEIFSGIFDLFKTYTAYVDDKSSTICVTTNLNMENLQIDEYKELSKLNEYFQVVNCPDVPQFTLLRDTFKIISKDSHHSSKKSQNIYLSFQGHNDSKFIVLNFVDKIFACNEIKDDIYISFSPPKSSESECKYININNEIRIFEHYKNQFSMVFECSVREELQIIFWKNLLRFAEKQEYDDILSEVSAETKKTFDVILKNMRRNYCTEDENFEERKKILISIATEYKYEERCVIQFNSFSGLILNVISNEMDQLITNLIFSDVFELVLLFKQICLCILKRINKLSQIYCTFSDILKDCRRKSITKGISLLEAFNISVIEENNSLHFDFILHRENQYFSLCELLQFLLSDENFECSELSNSCLSRFFSWFDIVIFESCIPFVFFENIQKHSITEQTCKKEIKKIEMFLQKYSHKNKCSIEYLNTEYPENSNVPCSHAIEKQELDISNHQEHVHQISSDVYIPSEFSEQLENNLQSTCFEELDDSSMLQIAFEWSVIFLVFNVIVKSYFFYITVMWIIMFHLHAYL